MATHFRLPAPITCVSGEGDRACHGVVWGRFCLICHQRPGDPRPLSCRPRTHTPPSSYLLDSHQSGSAAAVCIEKETRRGPDITQRASLCCLETNTVAHAKSITSVKSREESCFCKNHLTLLLLFWKNMIFKTLPRIGDKDQEELKPLIPVGAGFVNSPIQIDYCVVLSNPGM